MPKIPMQVAVAATVITLLFANGLLIAPYTLNIESIYGDEGVYARHIECFLQGQSPYIGFNSPYGPWEFIIMKALLGRDSFTLLDLRLAAVCLNFVSMSLLFAVGIQLFGKRSPYALVPPVLQGVFGPQLAGNVAYVDFTCLPFLCAWIFGLNGALNGPDARCRNMAALTGFCTAVLCFTKPQYGLGCVTVCWSMALKSTPRPLRFMPLLAVLFILSGSHRHPALLLVLGGAWVWFHSQEVKSEGKLGPVEFATGFFLGLLLLIGIASLEGMFLNVLFYPMSIAKSASGVRGLWSSGVQLIPRDVQSGMILALLFFSAVKWQGPVSVAIQRSAQIMGFLLFFFSFGSPPLMLMIRGVQNGELSEVVLPLLCIALVGSLVACVFELVRTPLHSEVDFVLRSAAIICLAASYDLAYIHARLLAVISLPLLFHLRYARPVLRLTYIASGLATVGLGLVIANLPYYLDLRQTIAMRRLIPTDYGALDAVRGRIYLKRSDFQKYRDLIEHTNGEPSAKREVIDVPGLAFLLGNYTQFQTDFPGYNFALGLYPDPRNSSKEILLPDYLRYHEYVTKAQRYRPLEARGGILILGPRRSGD
ncbi:hypothetical protein IV102_19485 [bacterium]|nr:hypothetical protein [bacterium]